MRAVSGESRPDEQVGDFVSFLVFELVGKDEQMDNLTLFDLFVFIRFFLLSTVEKLELSNMIKHEFCWTC